LEQCDWEVKTAAAQYRSDMEWEQQQQPSTSAQAAERSRRIVDMTKEVRKKKLEDKTKE
jgi:hypothetical protein